jgi:large repetitive protein
VGATATITYTVTVHNPDTGGKLMVNTVASADPGSTCPPGSADPACTRTVPVLTPALTIVKTASVATAAPGQQVTYTITITNTGQTPYAAAVVTDDLTGALDDAAYGGDAAATAGTLSYASPVLTWTGDLAVGATATITYTMTVNNPATGDQSLTNTVTSAAAGSNCPAGSTDPRCALAVNVAILTLLNTADVTTAVPRQVVRFTSTFTNGGQVPYTAITVSNNAADVFDDASYNGDATATSGTLTLAGTGLSWTGDIAVGGSVTVTGTVTVSNPDPGNKVMTGTLVSAAPGSNCPAGSADPQCTVTVTVLIPQLTITKAADASTAAPGQVVRYTVTAANTGQAPYTGAIIADDLTSVLNDAAYDGDAAASSGTVGYSSPELTWTGDLAVGATATIGYTVTVRNPETGDLNLLNTVISDDVGSTCPGGGPAPGCTVSIPVIRGALSMTAPGAADLGAADPGDVVSGSLGAVQVTDDRAIAGADWAATVSTTDFTNTGVAPAQTISAANASYRISSPITTTGTATFASVPFTALAGIAQGIVSVTNADGDNSATWDPVLQISVPTSAVGGSYSAVITHSVA